MKNENTIKIMETVAVVANAMPAPKWENRLCSS